MVIDERAAENAFYAKAYAQPEHEAKREILLRKFKLNINAFEKSDAFFLGLI